MAHEAKPLTIDRCIDCSWDRYADDAAHPRDHTFATVCAVCREPIIPHNATFWRHVAPPTYPGEGKGGAA